MPEAADKSVHDFATNPVETVDKVQRGGAAKLSTGFPTPSGAVIPGIEGPKKLLNPDS
jgi:hypothetical protein